MYVSARMKILGGRGSLKRRRKQGAVHALYHWAFHTIDHGHRIIVSLDGSESLDFARNGGVGNSGDHYYLFSPTQHVNRQGHKIDMAQQLLTTVAISLFAVTAISAADKSNIVFIFIDDWAWNGTPVAFDVAMTNSRMPVLQIPNLEKLSEEGTKSWNAYTSPQCSPSRNRNNRQRL